MIGSCGTYISVCVHGRVRFAGSDASPEIRAAVRNNPLPWVRTASGGWAAQVSCSINDKVIKYSIFMRIKAARIRDYNHITVVCLCSSYTVDLVSLWIFNHKCCYVNEIKKVLWCCRHVSAC